MGSTSADTTSMPQAATTCPIVIIGPTQTGKSTFIGKVISDGQELPAVGTGDGESVTTTPRVFQTLVGLLLDTVGVNDSKCRFTNELIGQHIQAALLELAASGATEVKFLLTESLPGDSIHLRNLVEVLILTFGRAARGSSLVLATKADCLSERQKSKRLEKLDEVVQELGLGGWLPWQSENDGEELDPAVMRVQIDKLKATLEKLPPIKLEALEDLQTRIQAKARELCENQVPIEKEENLEVETEIQVPYDDKETYMAQTVRYVDHEEEYQVTEVTSKTVKETRQEARPGIAGWIGMTTTSTVEREVPSFQTKTKTKTVQRPVVEDKEQTRTLEKFRAEKKMVTQQKLVFHRLPEEKFLADARELVVKEVREELRAK